jgi:hypothetical protein
MQPKTARLAALGAYAVCVALIAIYALVAWVSRHTSTGGIRTELSVVTWISVGLVVLSLVVLHVAIAGQLMYLGKGGGAKDV